MKLRLVVIHTVKENCRNYYQNKNQDHYQIPFHTQTILAQI